MIKGEVDIQVRWSLGSWQNYSGFFLKGILSQFTLKTDHKICIFKFSSIFVQAIYYYLEFINEFQMRKLIMSHLIWIYAVSKVIYQN